MNETTHSELAQLKEKIELNDQWELIEQHEVFTLKYAPYQTERPDTPNPGRIRCGYNGNMWSLASNHLIGEDFPIQHAGVLSISGSITCQHLDDSIEAVNHAMKHIESEIQENLSDPIKTSLEKSTNAETHALLMHGEMPLELFADKEAAEEYVKNHNRLNKGETTIWFPVPEHTEDTNE